MLGTNPATQAVRRRLADELAIVRARWEAEARACGFSDPRAQADEAEHRADSLLGAAGLTPACSLASAVAKLAIAAQWGDPADAGHPWPHLWSALSDLAALLARDGRAA